MSCKQETETTLFLFVLALSFNTFQISHSVSLGQRGDGFSAHQVQPRAGGQRGERRPVRQAAPGPDLRPGPAAAPAEPLPRTGAPKPDETDGGFALHVRSWTVGNISRQTTPSASDAEDGYQADFTGYDGVQGKVLGSSFDSSPHFSDWLAMRPLVQCDNRFMTFTATGQGLTHLLVDREGTSPISPFQLPPYCGYSVRTSWSDLEMMVPYDACYITKENGSYVLPLLWWGSPLKLSCPMQMSTPAPPLSRSAPLVFCSPYGMAVQILVQEQDIPMLGVMVSGGRGPFVSEACAYHVHANPGELAFFISYAAPCITSRDGFHLQLIVGDQEYILSCPVNSQFPYVPSLPSSPPPAPGDPQFSYIPDPVSPAPASPPPQSPTQGQIVQLPYNPYYPDPGFQYPQLPQVYPPGPQPAPLPQPTPGSPPGPQQQQQSFYPMGPSKLPYFPGGHPKYPSPPYQHPAVVQAPPPSNLSSVEESYPHQASKLPVGPSQYPAGLYYPYVPQAPAPLPSSPPSPPPSPPKQPVIPQYPVGPFYPPAAYHPSYHYGQFSYPEPGPEVQLASTSHPPPPTTTTATRTMHPYQPHSPSDPFGQFYPQRPIYFPPPTSPPPAKEKPHTVPQEPQKPAAPQVTCPPYAHTICSYYHPLYPPQYHPPYPPVPQYPEIPPPMTTQKPLTSTTTTATPTTPTGPTLQIPSLQCLVERMIVFLPFAHPDSIQVIDQMKTWLSLSSVSPQCGFMLQIAEGAGVILHSPLPACYSQPGTPTTISLALRFWDLSTAQYRTLDLQCPYQTTPETPAPVTPSVPTTPPSTSPNVAPKPKVLCSSHHMTVALPSGPISEIAVKDIEGNQMNLQDAPQHCGYSARKGKDGKILLTLQLQSQCYMSVQGNMYIIIVCYMTVNGRQEAPFLCPVVIPGSGQECNLPSEQHLPCGPGSVSEPQCLSMGCCFSKHPPACYYPMDECTIDRHFVFTVPATLTEPPLSPALLVAAGDSTCKPQKVTSDYALFKIPMDGCGTRRIMVGKTLIYIVEVINMVQTISLNYGTITRDSPVRLLVECRYLPNTVLSVSYMVKTPTLGPEIQTQGVFGVQLRIAKDAHYSSYYPQYHQPLQMLLRKPLHLEVQLLNAPDPDLVLLVHYCVAYPRSGNAVWLLLYNGCPNPLDPAMQEPVLFAPHPPSPPAQTRRFTISTFQFLPDGEFKDLDEEIYFMCSTEICSRRDGPCVEGCFGQ